MATCNSVQSISPSECIGDSLVKINNNFNNLDTNTCSLLTMVNVLSSYIANNITETQYEAVIGSAETTAGILSADVLPQGNTRPPVVSRLADFNYKKADGSEIVIRMEGVNLTTFKPWANFFPYKPSVPGKVLSKTKFFVLQANTDWSSVDYQTYTLLVDWEISEALLTGNYINTNLNGNHRHFIKRWNFEDFNTIQIKNDSNVPSLLTDTEGESNTNYSSEVYGFSTIMSCNISPTQGIIGIPLWTYYNALGPYKNFNSLKETSNISIFIENIYKPVFPGL